MAFRFGRKLVYNALILALVLMPGKSEGRTLSPRNHESGAKHVELEENRGMDKRDSTRISTGLQPCYVSNSNTVYGGYSSKPLRLDKNRLGGLSVGSTSFYKQDLYSYIKQGDTPTSGIFGFAAHFDASAASSDYTFFKSVPNDRNQQLQAKTSSPNNNNNNIIKRDPEFESINGQKISSLNRKRQQPDRVQCKNQSGEANFFSKNECFSAASRMTSEKTAISTCGGCKLVMIGPQGELSSSNMPASDLQAHASNILAGCVMGRRVES